MISPCGPHVWFSDIQVITGGHGNFLEGDLNEAATAADASRDTIWQGNCDVADPQLRNNIAPIRNTIPIQYPISNCPAKKGFLQVAVSKARRAACLLLRSLLKPARFRYSTKTSGESGGCTSLITPADEFEEAQAAQHPQLRCHPLLVTHPSSHKILPM